MVSTRQVTASELLEMGSEAPFELVQGELVRVSPSSPTSNLVLTEMIWQIYSYVRARRLGYVNSAEAGFLVEEAPDSVISPDIAYVARERMPKPLPKRGFWRVCPDLIVEVVSPTDEQHDRQSKQALYDRIRVPLVWWIDPQRESATVHIPGKPIEQFDRNGTLDSGAILPGFMISLADLFTDY